jgi:sulfite exporter TauE/SafE
MTNELLALSGTAVGIGFIHTFLGPDHYIPFIALAHARKWSAMRTAAVTFVCGMAHVLSSVVLGFAGILLGIGVGRLERLEAHRGNVAGWLLLIFGLVYFIWGLRRAARGRAHVHGHHHADGKFHAHAHDHFGEHVHVHDSESSPSVTPWVLFTIFVFGPCEPLIPLIMYPAARSDIFAVVVTATLFGAVTIATMLALVMASYFGLARLSFPRLERYAHALAGFTLLLCGGAVTFLGL